MNIMNTKFKVTLAFLSIFLIGAVSGYMVHASFDVAEKSDSEETQRVHPRQFDSDEERAEHYRQARQRIQNRMSDRLDLTESQSDPFFEILEEYHKSMRDTVHSLREEEKAILQREYGNFRHRASEILNEDQLARLDNYLHPDSVRHARIRRGR
jgi:Spy/CpxP family protein refolding chaperone